MDIFHAILQGIIQGATEFLPVSSSGHLSLIQHFLGIHTESLFFDIMLHVGTLIAVLAVYYKTVGRLICEFFKLIGDIFTGRFHIKQMSKDRRLLIMLIVGLLPLFFLFLPVPGTEMRVKDIADIWATDNDILVEGCSFIATGILLSLGIMANKESGSRLHKEFHLKDAISVGITQCFAAVFPGLSRSGSTLSAAMICSVEKESALDYSFILGIPSILAAAVLSAKDAGTESISIGSGALVAGMVTAAVVGFFAIRLLRFMVASDKLHIFATYTLILGVVVVILGIIEHKTGVNVFTGAALFK